MIFLTYRICSNWKISIHLHTTSSRGIIQIFRENITIVQLELTLHLEQKVTFYSLKT